MVMLCCLVMACLVDGTKECGRNSLTLPLPHPQSFTLRMIFLLFCIPKLRVGPVRSVVPFWGQTTQVISSLSPIRDYGPERVKLCSCNWVIDYMQHEGKLSPEQIVPGAWVRL